MSGDTAKRRATDQAGVVAVVAVAVVVVVEAAVEDIAAGAEEVIPVGAVAAEVIPAEDIPEVVAAIPAEGEVVVAEVVAVEVRDHHSF